MRGCWELLDHIYCRGIATVPEFEALDFVVPVRRATRQEHEHAYA